MKRVVVRAQPESPPAFGSIEFVFLLTVIAVVIIYAIDQPEGILIDKVEEISAIERLGKRHDEPE